LLCNKVTPFGRILEKLIAAKLVKFPAFYETQKSITMFGACWWSLSWVRWI